MLLTGSTTGLSNNQSKYGRRFNEEFKRGVAALASRPGVNQEQVVRDLGVSPYSVTRWSKLYAEASGGPLPGIADHLTHRTLLVERLSAAEAAIKTFKRP